MISRGLKYSLLKEPRSLLESGLLYSGLFKISRIRKRAVFPKEALPLPGPSGSRLRPGQAHLTTICQAVPGTTPFLAAFPKPRLRVGSAGRKGLRLVLGGREGLSLL